MKNFEWDARKRIKNLQKHDIDFIDAIEIFTDQDRIEAESTKEDEVRYKTIGKVSNTVIFLVYTYRDKKRRVISARRASKNERKIYEKAKENS